MNNATYLAITTGPITKTIQKANSTRELWVASYFLSKLMEIIIKLPLIKAGLLSPYLIDDASKKSGAGVYPDRAYWRLDKALSKEEIEKLTNDVLITLSKEVSDLISVDELKSYLKLYWVQAVWTEEELAHKSFLFRLNEVLDGLELQEKWEQSNPLNLINFLIAKDRETGLRRPVYKWRKESAQNGLFPYVLEKDIERFPSITEICTRQFYEEGEEWYISNVMNDIVKKLSSNDESLNDDQYMEKIKDEFNKGEVKSFLSRHKYICIIQSDGDGVGSYLRNNVGNDTKKLTDFSELLATFSIDATQMVVDYGGVPIYAGGDDLLFFAPVKDKYDGKCILHLLEDLDKEFKAKFLNSSMSQSFGLSITYYKFPLSEALDKAVSLLFSNAKQQPCKNYTAVKLQKHSGQNIDFGFNLNSSCYHTFKSILEDAIVSKESFLNSVMYKLDDQLSILNKIASDEEKLILFFDNNFNESSHQKYKDFFKKLAKYIKETFDYYNHENIDQKVNRIYGSLRFIQFLNAKDKDDE